MGKAYANRKSTENRPEGDFYSTPKSLIWVAKPFIEIEMDKHQAVLEPCFGDGAISQEVESLGYSVTKNDLFRGGVDYITNDFYEKQVITNPPFSLWDAFVNKAKSHAKKILVIGRLNYFGTQGRLENHMWDNLKAVYCFSRYVDYQTPYREDGHFHVGAMATAWFLWDMEYTEKPTIGFIDVQQYATLGNYKSKK
jgi:hypothetical protein